MEKGIGHRFQEETKYSNQRLGFHIPDRQNRPETYKTYAAAVRFPLPAAGQDAESPIWKVMGERRSIRSYSDRPLTLEQLSRLLWASQGITRRIHGYDLRTAPSAGALYPVETYMSVQAVAGLEKGIYHYHVPDHSLELLAGGDHRESVSAAALGQSFTEDANLVFIWTAVFGRSRWKYGERAYRYVYLDAGHIAQNLALASVALGLGSCQIAALFDNEANSLIGVDGREESVIYMTAVGHPATEEGQE